MRIIINVFALSFISLITNFLIYLITNSWLLASGLIYLDGSLYIIICTSVICTGLAISGLFYQMSKKKETVCVLLSFLLGCLAFLELFIGLTLVFDVRAYVSTFGWEWSAKARSKNVIKIMKKYNCCGFHKVGEYNLTKCGMNHPKPCLVVLADVLSGSIKKTGYIFLFNFFLHFSSIPFVWYDFWNKDQTKIIVDDHAEESFLKSNFS